MRFMMVMIMIIIVRKHYFVQHVIIIINFLRLYFKFLQLNAIYLQNFHY